MLALIVQSTAAAATPVAPAPAAPVSAPPVSATPVSYGPAVPVPARPALGASAGAKTCASVRADDRSQDIIVCASPGFRIDPDVLRARTAMKARRAGRPTSPYPQQRLNPTCGTIGPMGCRGTPTIDLLRVATVGAAMVQRALSGGNIGQLFVTDPQPSEYQLYLAAKQAREADEAATAKAKPAAAAPVASIVPALPSTRP